MTTTLGPIGLYVERLLLQHASLQADRQKATQNGPLQDNCGSA